MCVVLCTNKERKSVSGLARERHWCSLYLFMRNDHTELIVMCEDIDSRGRNDISVLFHVVTSTLISNDHVTINK